MVSKQKALKISFQALVLAPCNQAQMRSAPNAQQLNIAQENATTKRSSLNSRENY